jgi:hypothetical protein
MLLLLLALYLEVRVLVECYREYREKKRENDKCPSEPYKASGGELSQLRRSNGDLGLMRGDGGCRNRFVSWCLALNLRKRAARIFDALLKLFGARHRPNGKYANVHKQSRTIGLTKIFLAARDALRNGEAKPVSAPSCVSK